MLYIGKKSKELPVSCQQLLIFSYIFFPDRLSILVMGALILKISLEESLKTPPKLCMEVHPCTSEHAR